MTEAKKYKELKGSTNPAERKEFDRWFFKYEPEKEPGLKNKRKNKLSEQTGVKEQNDEQSKTIAIDESYSLKKNRRTRKQNRKKTSFFKQTRELKEDGPYAKRTFNWRRR